MQLAADVGKIHNFTQQINLLHNHIQVLNLISCLYVDYRKVKPPFY